MAWEWSPQPLDSTSNVLARCSPPSFNWFHLCLLRLLSFLSYGSLYWYWTPPFPILRSTVSWGWGCTSPVSLPRSSPPLLLSWATSPQLSHSQQVCVSVQRQSWRPLAPEENVHFTFLPCCIHKREPRASFSSQSGSPQDFLFHPPLGAASNKVKITMSCI